MPARPTVSIPTQLNGAQMALSNTLADAEIQSIVAAYGYPAARMQDGKTLYEAALHAVNVQAAAQGAQRAATAHARSTSREAQDAFQRLAQIARALFARDSSQLAALGLTGTMPRTTAPFLAAAETLFANAQTVADIKTSLAAHGYDDAKLTAEAARITAFDLANQAQEAAKGAAQQATRDQAAALAALADWISQFSKIARVALRDKKELGKKIGVISRTQRTAAQRHAPVKSAQTRQAGREKSGEETAMVKADAAA